MTDDELDAKLNAMLHKMEAVVEVQRHTEAMMAQTLHILDVTNAEYRIQNDRRKIEGARIKADIRQLAARVQKLEGT